MAQHIPRLKTGNVLYADAYIKGNGIFCVELLLQSTRSASGKVYNDAPLARASNEFQEIEEQRLEINLDKLSYELDDVTTVKLITGSDRVEHYLYPLLYLLLRRHFDIIRLAYNHVLHQSEWDTMNTSLEIIFQAVEERSKKLEAFFDDNLLDVKQPSHSSILFQLHHDGHKRDPDHPSRNSIALFKTEEGYDWADEDLGPYPNDDADTIKAALSRINSYILRYPLQD
ncbi:Protein kinase domain-containing protein [Mycena sanguinolenta]|uniref:Protein kinase domain-containing protein n=1 Tax=Mycena sanguinolenta TaxID=230812 RepID=A0A8H6Z6J1_9AGAR|nr:Protein kinase domain-containing protein [Mycena sanguinolenta]